MKKLVLSVLLLSLTAIVFSQPGLFLTNFATSGSLGTAAATYETNALVHVNQTTPGVTLTVSTPSNVLASKNFTIANNGSVPFTLVPGGNVSPGTGVIYRWDGAIFEVTGAGGMSVSQSACKFLVSPTTTSGYPEFRSLTIADLPLPPGTVHAYAGGSVPTGYLLCDGSAVSRTVYSALFSIVSTTYGPGDGSTTFNLPDIRQRFPLGKANSGTGSTLGSTGGSIDHLHTVDPPNTTSTAPSGTIAATNLLTTAASPTHTHDINIVQFNSGTENPPFIVLNYIIKH